MLPTAWSDLVGCRHPIQQAGMGAVAGPELARAVSAAGALGMVGGAGWPPAALAVALDPTVGVNFLVPFLDRAAVEAASSRCRVVELFYGDPDPALVALVHEGGALCAWQVGSAEEARAAAGAGCDFVVAQGVEAGGHVRGTTPLHDLMPEVREALAVPVVAAGGIATGADMAEAVRRGADAVRVGTRFVATVEADAHAGYQHALVEGEETVVTSTFNAEWDAPHRVLRSCVGEPGGSVMPPTRAAPGDVRRAALYAGTSVARIHAVTTAAAVVEELVREAPARLVT